MGMTIKEAEINLHAIQVYYNDDMQDSYVGFDKEDNESVEVAIETMRKYQMIEQIRHRVKYTDLEPAKAYELINEVLEDGKID